MLIQAGGFDAIHTLDLPAQNKTPDNIINTISLGEGRIVITKDTDFLDSHLLHQRPEQLVLVTTGNIRNTDLLKIFESHLVTIVEMLRHSSLVEVVKTEIISHRR